jgi:hypothetical protein
LAVNSTGKDHDAVPIGPTLAAKISHRILLKVVGFKVKLLKTLGGVTLRCFIAAS